MIYNHDNSCYETLVSTRFSFIPTSLSWSEESLSLLVGQGHLCHFLTKVSSVEMTYKLSWLGKFALFSQVVLLIFRIEVLYSLFSLSPSFSFLPMSISKCLLKLEPLESSSVSPVLSIMQGYFREIHSLVWFFSCLAAVLNRSASCCLETLKKTWALFKTFFAEYSLCRLLKEGIEQTLLWYYW